ncbi:modulator protein [Pontibacillus halophilus JSM 076056 = DSM 19796]|uniref:Modulator protein n=1 Tax=Pontibacillus halophilus JSM 076056 = DSM 19796 TaxID=1385510 RepID=A0A0A5GKH8_9BACI|nr:STAS domain-containing protein [Pontibacillus halophilus]KGX91665.1 modulator protein [Pontibacillus halophilus JSM 076056 = DSM 19796]
MKEELAYLHKRLLDQEDRVVDEVRVLQDPSYLHTLEQAGFTEEDVRSSRTAFFRFLVDSITQENQDLMKEYREWLMHAGSLGLKKGVPLPETVRNLSRFRDVIMDFLAEELKGHELAAITMVDVSRRVNVLMDEMIYYFHQVYMSHHRHLLNLSNTDFKELSVPVVPVSDDVAVLPLIGEIDTDRASLIMEVALEKSLSYKVKHLIMDTSGVPMIDTMVAHHIVQIVTALELVGVDAQLTGIRPEIARTLVDLGVRFENIRTESNLKKALSKIGFAKSTAPAKLSHL